MKTKILIGLLIAIAASGFFAGCDLFELYNPGASTAATYEPLIIWSIGAAGEQIEVEITTKRTVPRTVLTPTNGDSYVIRVDGVVTSRGTIIVDNIYITFYPSNGAQPFAGSYNKGDNYIALYEVPTEDGGIVAGPGLTGGGGGGSSGYVAVKSVSLNTTSLSIGTGGTETLVASVSPSNATIKMVTWFSSKPTAATVDPYGVVTATGAVGDTAIITVKTADGSKTATCAVTVTDPIPVTGVTLNKNVLALNVNRTETLKATIAPANATIKTVTWTSDNVTVATVTAGLVTAVSAGSATITVKTDDGNFTETCAVTVGGAGGNVAVTGVTLGRSVLYLNVNGTYTLGYTVMPEGATNKAVTWSTNNAIVASVNNGIVTGASNGGAEITVTTVDGGFMVKCDVYVFKGADNSWEVVSIAEYGDGDATKWGVVDPATPHTHTPTGYDHVDNSVSAISMQGTTYSQTEFETLAVKWITDEGSSTQKTDLLDDSGAFKNGKNFTATFFFKVDKELGSTVDKDFNHVLFVPPAREGKVRLGWFEAADTKWGWAYYDIPSATTYFKVAVDVAYKDNSGVWRVFPDFDAGDITLYFISNGGSDPRYPAEPPGSTPPYSSEYRWRIADAPTTGKYKATVNVGTLTITP